MQHLLLIDGQNLAFRLIHRPGPPLSHEGVPTTGIHAFAVELFRLVDRLKPTHAAVAWDIPRSELERRRLYAGYKANRDGTKPSPEVAFQLRWIRNLCRAAGLRGVTSHGWEADDVIATLAARFKGRVTIVTRDKDLQQLVSSRVRIFDGGDWIGTGNVEATWGVEPDRVVEVQTLAGDSVDGVPGVPGVGLKRAKDLVTRYGDADRACRAWQRVGGKTGLALRDFDPELGRQLVRLRADVPVFEGDEPLLDLEDLAFTEPNTDALEPLFAELGFRPWWSSGSVPIRKAAPRSIDA